MNEFELDDDDLIAALTEALPELHSTFRAQVDMYDTPMGAHVIYGDVLNPALISALHDPDLHEEFLKRAFAFLEDLLQSGGTVAANVVSATVCERLIDDPRAFDAAVMFMRPQTARTARELANAWHTARSEHD